jgi:hypothetical protein
MTDMLDKQGDRDDAKDPASDSPRVTAQPGYVVVEAKGRSVSGGEMHVDVLLKLGLDEARSFANNLLQQSAEAEMLRRWVN